MFHLVTARIMTWVAVSRDAIERRSQSRSDSGMEAIQVVVLSAIGLAIVIALGAAIKALVEKYQAQLI